MSLTDLLGGAMKQQLVGMVAQKLGVNQQVATTAVNFALPLLLNGLSKNTQTPEGADSLHQAISKDHNGSILDNLSGLMQNPEQGPGAGILNHILGANQAPATDAISQNSGLDANQTSQMLQMLAPVLMGTLGKQQQAENLDSVGLAGMLRETTQKNQEQQAPDMMNLLSGFLDKNKDGNVADDALGMLGNLLK